MKFRSDLEALILAVLDAGPKHGYAIVKAIKLQSEDVLKLGEAQLYPVLHRLEETGLILGEWIPEEGKPSKKVYTLTESGRKGLEVRRKDWEKFSKAIGGLMTQGAGS